MKPDIPLQSRQTFLTMRVINHWEKIPRGLIACSFLDVHTPGGSASLDDMLYSWPWNWIWFMDNWIECATQCLMAFGRFGPLKPLAASGNDLAVLWGFPAGDPEGLLRRCQHGLPYRRGLGWVTHHMLDLWKRALLTPKQMRHGLNQPPRAPRDGGQIWEVQVRALWLFLAFGKTSWDSKELGARAGEITLIYGGNNNMKGKVNLIPLQGQSRMRMGCKPLPFSLASAAFHISLRSQPQQFPKTLISVMLQKLFRTYLQPETESPSRKPPLDFMCPRHFWGSYSHPVALLPLPSHCNPVHLFRQLGAVSKQLKFCFSTQWWVLSVSETI